MKKIISRLLLIVFCAIMAIIMNSCGSLDIKDKKSDKYNVVNLIKTPYYDFHRKGFSLN